MLLVGVVLLIESTMILMVHDHSWKRALKFKKVWKKTRFNQLQNQRDVPFFIHRDIPNTKQSKTTQRMSQFAELINNITYIQRSPTKLAKTARANIPNIWRMVMLRHWCRIRGGRCYWNSHRSGETSREQRWFGIICCIATTWHLVRFSFSFCSQWVP